jgi:LytS/YehU family sensor histidine kinase
MREQREAALAARAGAHLAQLKMLRYQLNPHFLFNTLNAVTTLNLEGDTATANRVVERLSAFLRHSLDGDPMERVTVLDEMRSLDLYLDIEKVRFAERLRVEVTVDPECREALLPALLLQPLVENAIKHAVARSIEGCSLRLEARREADRLRLTVADDGPGAAPGAIETRTGVGLRNTAERLRVLYGDDQALELGIPAGGGCEVRLSLPFERREQAT